VNNAGATAGNVGWRACINITLMGTCEGTYLALDKMSKENVTNSFLYHLLSDLQGGPGGRIVNVASYSSLVGGFYGDVRTEAYTAAKHGVAALTRGFGQYFTDVPAKHDVKCFAVCPYFVNTKMVTDGVDTNELERQIHTRMMRPEEVANAVFRGLQEDRNGAVYTVFPDSPPVLIRAFSIPIVVWLTLVGRLLGASGYKSQRGVITTREPLIITVLILMLIAYLIVWIANLFW